MSFSAPTPQAPPPPPPPPNPPLMASDQVNNAGARARQAAAAAAGKGFNRTIATDAQGAPEPKTSGGGKELLGQ